MREHLFRTGVPLERDYDTDDDCCWYGPPQAMANVVATSDKQRPVVLTLRAAAYRVLDCHAREARSRHYARWVVSFSESDFIRHACEMHLAQVIAERADRLFFSDTSRGSLPIPDCFGTPGSSDECSYRADGGESDGGCGYCGFHGPNPGHFKSDGYDDIRNDPTVEGNSDDDMWY